MLVGSRIALLTIAAAGAVLPGADPAMRKESSDFLFEKHLVRIEGERRLNLVCAGQGSPVVLFEQGTGGNVLNWARVASRVATITRACFYDRAGYGYSDPISRPSTAMNITDDLHNLVRRAQLKRPLILVGHSRGGFYSILYADRFPSEVAGLILIDPSFAGQDEPIPVNERSDAFKSFETGNRLMKACSDLARDGSISRGIHPECTNQMTSGDSERARNFLMYQFSRPNRYEALASEVGSYFPKDGVSDLDSRSEDRARRSFGNMPVTVFTREGGRDDPSIYAAWKAGHDKLAGRSAKGTSTVVKGAGHFIQEDRPAVVFKAISQMVFTIRKGESSARK